MNSIDFCFWLQGFFEITDANSVTDKQVEIIKNHLNLVFKHEIDPIRNAESELSPAVLQEIHDGIKFPPGGHGNDMLVRC